MTLSPPMPDFPAPDRLIPHRAPMQLIDRVIEAEADRTRAETTIRADNAFFTPAWGVPAYVGFEMMAQTICAFDGLARWREGLDPALGFLLGCRRYKARREWFVEGERLEIEARSLLEPGEVGSFDCRIFDAAGGEIAESMVVVFRPDDIEAYLAAAIQHG
jgi:predicted hotdog family 3-hydroxylacyl-ACP dehydratase